MFLDKCMNFLGISREEYEDEEVALLESGSECEEQVETQEVQETKLPRFGYGFRRNADRRKEDNLSVTPKVIPMAGNIATSKMVITQPTCFEDVKEIQKLSGLSLVACSSGKHKGETKISHRGRKRLRYWLFQAAKSVVAHSEEFKELHVYYTTRAENPLKKMQSLIVIACKLLRIIYTILKTGTVYDPKKMMIDIKHPEKQKVIAA